MCYQYPRRRALLPKAQTNASSGIELQIRRALGDAHLVRRHHFVLGALEQHHRAIQLVNRVDRRAGLVHRGVRRVFSDQSVEVPGLELVGVAGKHFQVADAARHIRFFA